MRSTAEMPARRTRSAASEQPDGNSSKVTDYLGPPATKRQKRSAEPANTSSRVTRSARAASMSVGESQSKAASTQHYTRQQNIEEDDDDDAVHVPFNKISSAVNEARFGPSRARGRVRVKNRQQGLNGVPEDEDESGAEDGQHGNIGSEETLPARKYRQPVKATRIRRQGTSEDQHVGPKTRSRVKVLHRVDDVNASPSEPHPQSEEQAAGGASRGRSSLSQTKRQPTKEMELVAPNEDAQPDDEDAASEDDEANGGIQGAAARAAEDSAFIDAPRPDERLPGVKCTFKSLRGMIKTLSHPAWTGKKDWDDDPDMTSSSRTAGDLMERLRLLNDLLVESYEARYEGDADGDPEVTIDYLRRHNDKIKSLFADTTELVDQICTQKLVNEDNIGTRAVQTRKRLLRDITKRLMPMLVLVLQKAYDVGPSEEKKGVVHLTLNSYTIQFPLRIIGWGTRLMEALSRGLKQWPIDDEFDQSDEELDIAEVAKRQAKNKARELFQEHLASLYLGVKKAANALETQANESASKARQEQHRQRAMHEEERRRRQAMIRGRELWAKAKRERQEDERKAQIQMERFARASQALRSLQDPLAEMWKEANLLNNGHARSQAGVDVPAPVHQRPKDVERVRSIPRVEGVEDYFLNMDKADQLSNNPGQIDPAFSKRRPENGRPRTINGLQNTRILEAWGAPRWSKEEEKKLVLKIKFDKTYNPSTLAPTLGRSAEDIGRKAAELKAVYRAIYTKRGTDIPVWAL